MPLGTALRHFLLWLCQEKQYVVINLQVTDPNMTAEVMFNGLRIWDE